MGRKSAKKTTKEELDIERVYIYKMWRLAQEYAKKLHRHEPVPAERIIHEEQDAYLLLLNATVNKQINMEKKGIPFPENCVSYQRDIEGYVDSSKIGKASDKITDAYIKCQRCEFRQKDDRGEHYCTVWKWRIDNTRFYTAQDDGCSRGLLSDEYR